jgi:hypothetical protein
LGDHEPGIEAAILDEKGRQAAQHGIHQPLHPRVLFLALGRPQFPSATLLPQAQADGSAAAWYNLWATATDVHHALAEVSGDFAVGLRDAQGRVLLAVDRMGIRTLRDPYTAKPWIVFYSTKRVGGGALNFEAIKFARFSA